MWSVFGGRKHCPAPFINQIFDSEVVKHESFAGLTQTSGSALGFPAVESEFHRHESGDRLSTTGDSYFSAARDLIEKGAQLPLCFERFDLTHEITLLETPTGSQMILARSRVVRSEAERPARSPYTRELSWPTGTVPRQILPGVLENLGTMPIPLTRPTWS